jgi:dolichol-phosphate mannosyltransferase
MKLGIAVPTYNESDNISKLVAGIEAAVKASKVPATLLIIDDNSPDGTGKIADALAAREKTQNFTVTVMHRKNKEGLGKAYIAGFQQLLKLDCTHILQMDADLSHDPSYIPFMIAAAVTADLVVGSRYIQGGATPDWTWGRRVQSKFGNLYARLFLGNKIHDYTGGFNLYTADLLRQIDISSLQATGYGFLIELKYRAVCHATSITEVPIIFLDRTEGNSKIPHNTIYKNLLLVPSLRFFRNK